MICPALAGLFLAGGARETDFFSYLNLPLDLAAVFQTVFLVLLTAGTCFAAPLMMRTLFANSLKNQHGAGSEQFFKFQQKFLMISLLTPFWSIFVMMFEFQKFHGSSIILMGLYSVYYYYPSERRIAFDEKIFRVK